MITITTSGVYSDYRVIAVLDWLKATPEEAKKAWLELHPEQIGSYNFEDHAFVAWLVREGYAKDTEAQELHLGDYSTADETFTVEPFVRQE